MSERCEGCKFWGQFSALSALRLAPGIAECRRYAPRGHVNYGAVAEDEKLKVIISAWAYTAKDGWCGEFVSISSDTN